MKTTANPKPTTSYCFRRRRTFLPRRSVVQHTNRPRYPALPSRQSLLAIPENAEAWRRKESESGHRVSLDQVSHSRGVELFLGSLQARGSDEIAYAAKPLAACCFL